jgi:hypothetical protein
MLLKSRVETAKSISAIIALSAILVWVSHTVTFQHLEESIHNQFAFIRAEPFIFVGKPLVIPAFYNRILFPAIFVFLGKILPSLTDVQIFLGLRFLSFLFCLAAIYIAAHRRWHSSTSDPLIVSSVLALSMVPTFNHGWVNSSDIFDLTFCFFMFLYVVEGKFVPAFLIACLTAINRETGAFAAIAFVCFAFGKQKFQSIALRAIMLAFIPYSAAVLVRKLVLGSKLALESTGQWYTGFSYNFALLTEAFKRPSPVGWPLLLFASMVLPWLVFLRRHTTQDFRFRVTSAFLVIFVITAAIGINAEVRTFIPCAALLIACTVALLDSTTQNRIDVHRHPHHADYMQS